MFTSIIDFGTPAFDEALVLRDNILRKPLNLEFTPDQISKEYESVHLGIYDDSFQLLGVLVLLPLDTSTVKMRQVAIQARCQGKGIGSQLVVASEVLSKQLGYDKIVLNARDTAVPFYQRLKYQRVGDPFIEVTIKHYRMEKSL